VAGIGTGGTITGGLLERDALHTSQHHLCHAARRHGALLAGAEPSCAGEFERSGCSPRTAMKANVAMGWAPIFSRCSPSHWECRELGTDSRGQGAGGWQQQQQALLPQQRALSCVNTGGTAAESAAGASAAPSSGSSHYQRGLLLLRSACVPASSQARACRVKLWFGAWVPSGPPDAHAPG
jgi:hypothetical protein